VFQNNKKNNKVVGIDNFMLYEVLIVMACNTLIKSFDRTICNKEFIDLIRYRNIKELRIIVKIFLKAHQYLCEL
jgi:hypothetical protein